MKKNYEAVLIFKETAGPLLDRAKKAVSDIIKSLEIEITGEDEWGKRDLTYKIKGRKEGYYLFCNLEAAPDKVKQIRSKLEVNDDLLRFLIYNKAG